jgi:5-methylcytosine-specific restriction protein A
MRRLNQQSDGLTQRKLLYKTKRWYRLRYHYLKNNPRCVRCGEKSRVLDHVDGHGDNWQKYFWSGPFQALCIPCHNRKTSQEERKPEPPPTRLRNMPWRRG